MTLQIQSDITVLRRKSEHINLYYTLKINNKTFNSDLSAKLLITDKNKNVTVM